MLQKTRLLTVRKWSLPYACTLHWIRCTLSFILFRSSIQCISATRWLSTPLETSLLIARQGSPIVILEPPGNHLYSGLHTTLLLSANKNEPFCLFCLCNVFLLWLDACVIKEKKLLKCCSPAKSWTGDTSTTNENRGKFEAH